MEEVAAKCMEYAPLDGANTTPLPGVSIYRRNAVHDRMHTVYQRSIFLVVQGRKQACIGDDVFEYNADRYLVTSVTLPVVTQILAADTTHPFMAIAIDFDLDVVREIVSLAGSHLPPLTAEPPQRGLASCSVTEEIRNATYRLVDLMDQPDDIPVMAPLCTREILYHVLKGPRGGFLRAVATGSGQQASIAKTLALIHTDCTQPFVVSDLASLAGMSESTFYEAFKSVTGAAPLQTIKRLRLQEAHRRLSSGSTNVSEAAYGVGYNSLSQFSREFTRVFGVNPSSLLS